MDTLSVTAQLILGSILGAGAFVICRKAGLDPFGGRPPFRRGPRSPALPWHS